MSTAQGRVLDTMDKGWKGEARKLMTQKLGFAVLNVTEATLDDCISLAQEFDFFLVQEFGEGKKWPRLATQFVFVPKTRVN